MAPRTIAAIEDDASLRDALTLLLQADGWVVKPYASGEHFLTELDASHAPDCVVLDLVLPGADGAQVLSQLTGRNIPTVVLTAFPDSDVAARTRSLGVDALLVKPVDPEHLLATLRACVRASLGRE